MAMNNDLSNYMKVMKDMKDKGKDKNVELVPSSRQQALARQNRKCAKCGRELNLNFSKYIQDPDTKTMKVLCSDCAIGNPRER
ncbi:MAG: hypothetical protein WC812_00300 [Candidatus Pacearchaeota archaeon]|jgi:DNA-directed RNA polymerase subunit RPC12/RpoP